MRLDKETRKQMANQYVQTHRPMGIYQAKNEANGKLFIGSSLNLDAIINRDKFILTLGSHSNKSLQRDWKEFGEDNFSFEILQFIKPREDIPPSLDEQKKYAEELEELEQIWMEELQPYAERGYHQKRKEDN